MLLANPVLQELNRRSVTEGRMLPLPVVEELDVFEAGGLHVSMSRIANPMHALVFEAVEPTLRRRVIPTIPLSAHRASHPVFFKLVLKRMAGVQPEFNRSSQHRNFKELQCKRPANPG